MFDTRDLAPVPGRVPAGGTITVTHAGRAGIPASGVGAVALTVTATDAGEGFVTAWPAGSGRPATSTLNLVAGDTRANSTLTRLGGGAVSFFTQAGAHLLADTSGYFTSPPAP